MMNPPPCSRAFTFVEILAAMIFLGILIPAILKGLTIASRAAVIAERQAIAAELAQNKLGELSLDGAWQSSQTSGNFGDDWPGMRWESEETNWDQDNAMQELTVRAYYTVRGQEQHIEMSTLVSSSSSLTGTATSSTSGSSSL